MKYFLLLLILAFLVIGCHKRENKVEQIGSDKYIITCPNDGMDCFTKAYEICPNGYRIDREYADFITKEPSCIFVTCMSKYHTMEGMKKLNEKLNECVKNNK